MRLTIALTVVAIAATLLLPGSVLELQRGGEPWRLVTCHFTHWSYEQLVWDALAFAALGGTCSRRNRAAFRTTLLASAIVVPLAVVAFAPEVAAYRGLSGIDSALFALLLTTDRRAWPFAIAFAAKIGFEAMTGSALFATNMGAGVVAVPVAHFAGAVMGAAIGYIVRPTKPLDTGTRLPASAIAASIAVSAGISASGRR